MKTLFFGLLILTSASSFAQAPYACDAQYSAHVGNGILRGKAFSIIVDYGTTVFGSDGLTNSVEITLGSTGRSNTMPKTKLTYAVIVEGETVLSGVQVMEVLPKNLSLSSKSSNAEITLDCTFN